MISLSHHDALAVPSALVTRFRPPQLDSDAAAYLGLFDRLARHDRPFVLLSDLRGFALDHAGQVAQNLAAKSSRAAIAARIRALVLVSDHPTERQRAAFSRFWSIPVEVHHDPNAANRAFLACHARHFG